MLAEIKNRMAELHIVRVAYGHGVMILQRRCNIMLCTSSTMIKSSRTS